MYSPHTTPDIANKSNIENNLQVYYLYTSTPIMTAIAPSQPTPTKVSQTHDHLLPLLRTYFALNLRADQKRTIVHHHLQHNRYRNVIHGPPYGKPVLNVSYALATTLNTIIYILKLKLSPFELSICLLVSYTLLSLPSSPPPSLPLPCHFHPHPPI